MDTTLKDALAGNFTSKVRPLSSEWLISFKDPRVLWEEHWFALVLEIANGLILYRMFQHAKRKGKDSYYLILASLFSALCFELLQIIPRPGYQLWWYHQGAVNFLKQRVPSFVVTTFAILHYVAYNLTRHSNLPTLTRSLVTAVCGVALYLPLLWLSPRLLLTFLHHDDFVFKDTILGIPYIQILVLFLLFLHTSQVFMPNYEAIKTGHRKSYDYVWCSIQSGLVASIFALVEQYNLYILISLTCKGNSGLCLLAAVSIAIWLAKAELKSLQIKSYTTAGILKPLARKTWWAAVAIFFFASTLPLWLNIENLKSNGSRLELGPCNIKHAVSNTSPLELPRRRYVCPEDGEMLNFNFNCVNAKTLQIGVERNSNNYTVCGKALQDPQQISTQIAIYSAICLCIFYHLARLSFNFTHQQKIEKDSIKLQ